MSRLSGRLRGALLRREVAFLAALASWAERRVRRIYDALVDAEAAEG